MTKLTQPISIKEDAPAAPRTRAQALPLAEPAAPSDAENIWSKPESCRACPLFLEPGPVWGKGTRAAAMMIVGEAPGQNEVDWPNYYDPDKHGPPRPGAAHAFRADRMAPFIGGSGAYLTKLMAHAGIHRERVWVTNPVKCRPPNNRLPTSEEINCCLPFIAEEIEDIQPNVIVTVGGLSLEVLAKKAPVGIWRGVPTAALFSRTLRDGTEAPYKIFPTWHPAFIMRAQYYYPFAVHDLERAKSQSEFPEIIRTPIHIVRDANTTRDRELVLEGVRKRGCFTFDFETTGLMDNPESTILHCGIVAWPDTAHVFNWTAGTKQLFQELLDDPKVEIIGQNILNFDLPFAEEKGVRVRWTNVFDTMVAFHLTNSSYGQTSVAEQNSNTYRVRGAEKDLSFIASNHTDIEYWKSREAYKNDLIGVCGTDCIATDRAATHASDGLKIELRKYGMEDLYWKHVLPVHPVLRRMTQRGVNVDVKEAWIVSQALEIEADQLEATLKEGLGKPDLNLNSSKQLLHLLYGPVDEGGMDLPPIYGKPKKGEKSGRPTADKTALETLAVRSPENVILRSIVDIRHKRKMKATFIDPMMETGRVHATFGVSKAANGRFNSWNPNAQNVPEDMRNIWIPDDEDHILISADSSQIEWRNAMVLSGDPVGLELLSSGVDNHKAVAAEALSKRIEDVTSQERHAAKFIVYGLGYGRGAASIASAHNLPFDFVQQFIARFFARFRVFKQWRDDLASVVKRQHYLANAWGRRRWWWTWEITEIYNYPASSTAADQMIEELLLLDRELPNGATLRLTVHDEVVLDCPKSIARETIECVRTCMQRQWPEVVEASANPDVVKRFYPSGWHVPADVGIGMNWRQCKSKDPEDVEARTALVKHLGLEDLFKKG
jgi:uracil-DNA glycosylase family 4